MINQTKYVQSTRGLIDLIIGKNMNYLKILGASGSKTKFSGTTSFQIYKDILIDAGNVINTLGEDIININHIK